MSKTHTRPAVLYLTLGVVVAIVGQEAHAQDQPQVIKPVPQPAQFQPGALGVRLIQVDSVIRASEARQRFSLSGAGLTAAVLDTGLRVSHQDFRSLPTRVLTEVNFTADNGGAPNNAADGQGHGTNVGGIIAANGVNVGISPGANIIPIKVLDNGGNGSFDGIERGVQWVLDNHSQFNITVVNMSLGDPGNYDAVDPFPTDSLRQKIKQLRSIGIAVVISAGNDFKTHNSNQGMSYPGIFPEAISVGAVYDADIGGPITYEDMAVANTTAADRVCPFSQRLFRDGESPTGLTTGTDVFAPGAAVRSTGILSDNGFSIAMHGTSQAAPATAGLILLMQEYHRRLTSTSPSDPGVLPSVDNIELWLRRGAVPVNDGDDEDDNVTNTGKTFRRIDAIAALDAITNQVQNELAKEQVESIPELGRIKALRDAQTGD